MAIVTPLGTPSLQHRIIVIDPLGASRLIPASILAIRGVLRTFYPLIPPSTSPDFVDGGNNPTLIIQVAFRRVGRCKHFSEIHGVGIVKFPSFLLFDSCVLKDAPGESVRKTIYIKPNNKLWIPRSSPIKGVLHAVPQQITSDARKSYCCSRGLNWD